MLGLLAAPHPARAAIEDQNRSKPPAEAPPAPVLTKAPELIRPAQPIYPEALLAEGVAGEVVLFIDIDERGAVTAVEVAKASRPEFSEPAVTAAKLLLFSPAELDGTPAPVRIEYRFGFVPQTPEAAPAIHPDPSAGGAATTVPAPINFAGRVREAGARKPIAGAGIELGGVLTATTDAEGRFEIRGAPLGKLAVRIGAAGFALYEIEEELGEGEGIVAEYYLERESRDPFETVVRTRQPRREVAKVVLQRQELEKIPGTFGDPVRVIENLPGLGRVPGGLGGALLVRGANPDDSRVFFDGVEVPLLYHFGGLTSIVPAPFLESIDFYPGGFSARFGRATAGIVDVKSRELDCELVRGSGKVDFIDAAAFVCVPVGTWKLAFAARRSYIDALLPAVLENIPRDEDDGTVTAAPVYFDYQLKASTNWGRHGFDIFMFGSSDELEVVRTGSLEDVNFSAGLDLYFSRTVLRDRWQLADGMTLTSTVSPGFTKIGFSQTASEIELDNGFDLGVWSIDWREQLDLRLGPNATLAAGLDVLMNDADVRVETPLQTSLRTFPSPTFDFTNSQVLRRLTRGYDHAYWAELTWDPLPGLRIIPGLRVERFDFYKSQYIAVLPRLAARWQLVEPTTLKASWGIFEKLPEPQYLSDGVGNPALLPERSQHFIAGVEHNFTETVQLDVQAFYNLRTQMRQPSDAVRFEDGRAVPEIWNSDGRGHTVGLEVLLRHLATPSGRFYGWLAYTLSRSRVEAVPGASMGGPPESGDVLAEERAVEEFAADFDQTHILTLVGQWVLPWKLEAGFRFRYVTGNPYTPYDEAAVFVDTDADAYQTSAGNVARNSARYPAFHQLDVRIDRTFTFDLWTLTAYLEVINAYNHKNVESYQYDYRYREKTPLSLLPIVPILGVKGEF